MEFKVPVKTEPTSIPLYAVERLLNGATVLVNAVALAVGNPLIVIFPPPTVVVPVVAVNGTPFTVCAVAQS
jgi:hypothetical protein